MHTLCTRPQVAQWPQLLRKPPAPAQRRQTGSKEDEGETTKKERRTKNEKKKKEEKKRKRKKEHWERKRSLQQLDCPHSAYFSLSSFSSSLLADISVTLPDKLSEGWTIGGICVFPQDVSFSRHDKWLSVSFNQTGVIFTVSESESFIVHVHVYREMYIKKRSLMSRSNISDLEMQAIPVSDASQWYQPIIPVSCVSPWCQSVIPISDVGQ